ncbi:nucleoside triphosphate pyrophosphohydrolase [Herbinix luporum]|jgi:tetrapyrrole methylase family protein/MazG family protein|uniref:nucleoside triphosphate pyrophosphohydrolase n=1 Tax=Herbinix luporum TaxID=1679721 RepID=UPI0023F204F8|nr:nucleoside triphosphate pyrophosphohydrolase [Herbinix luporum]
MDKTYSFNEFMDIIRKLRSKEGCPWDREQTHESLRQCLIEEAYEVIEAINNQDSKNLCEELGDLLLQVAMHSVIAEETGEFTVEDVISEESRKMIRRHPHVFGNLTADSTKEVLKNWEDIKALEKSHVNNPEQDIKSVPKALPALIRARKVQEKAVKYGLDPGSPDKALDDITKGLDILRKAIEIGEKSRIINDFGNLLFQMIKLSVVLQINAENSLTNAINQFINRFIDVLYPQEGNGHNLCAVTAHKQEALWWEKN